MKVLIVGSGGREHAIAASVAKSPKADKTLVRTGQCRDRRVCRVCGHRRHGV